MYKLSFYFVACFLFITNYNFAQTNEGFLKLKQTNDKNEISFVTWYFKADKVACLVESRNNKNEPINYQLAFDRNNKKLFITYLASNYTIEVSPQSISAPEDINNGLIITTLPNNKLQAAFKQNESLEINSQLTQTTAEYSTDLPFDWSLYSDFLKDDYVISAMITQKIKGIPINAVTKYKDGKILKQTEFVAFKIQKVDNNLFK